MLEKAEIEAIAAAVVTQVKESKHAFYIEPEQHYRDHLTMREMDRILSSSKSMFFRAFVGLVILGSIFLAAIGLGMKVDW